MNGEMDRKIERGFQIWELLIDSESKCMLFSYGFVRPALVLKVFFLKTSHRIFGHMHRVLNIDKMNN